MGKTLSEKHAAAVERIKQFLVATSLGQVATFRQLDAAAGQPVRQYRWLLSKAMELATKETGSFFRSVRNIGYKRIHGAQNYLEGERYRKHSRRVGRKVNQRMKWCCDKTNDMSDPDRRRSYAEQATVGLLVHLARDRQITRIVDKTEDRPPSLTESVAATAAVMREIRAQRSALRLG